MHPEMDMLRVAIVRAGSSKGIFIKKNELPQEPKLRDKVVQAIFGSPDIRQIDGLGGADLLTSKLAIISPSSREDADVDYTFGQVSFDDDIVDYGGNCGNISAGVGPFAIDEGMIEAVEPITTVRIHMTNSGRILRAQVPVKDGKAKVCGDYAIAGVPGTGAKITLDWSDAVGAITGKALPTGQPKEKLHVKGKDYEVSIVDAGNPHVFIHAKSLGLKGTESPNEIDSNKELNELIEAIRGEACVKLGFVEKGEDAAKVTPYQPFFAIVSEPADYVALNGDTIHKEDMHLVSRLLFMLHMHKTYPISGTVCTGAAMRIPGTIPYEITTSATNEGKEDSVLKIGHPAGIIPVEAECTIIDGTPHFHKIGVYRTARRIMDGYVYVKKDIFQKDRSL